MWQKTKSAVDHTRFVTACSTRVILEHIDPQKPREPDVDKRQRYEHACDNRKDPEVERLIEKRTHERVDEDSFGHIKHVIHVHCAKKIAGFLVEPHVAVAAFFVHFWESEREHTLFVEDFSFVTIRTFGF